MEPCPNIYLTKSNIVEGCTIMSAEDLFETVSLIAWFFFWRKKHIMEFIGITLVYIVALCFEYIYIYIDIVFKNIMHSYFYLRPSSSMNGSVRPSVCPSVTPFWLCSHHRIIMKFSGVVTNDKSDVHAKGQSSKVKITEVNSQLSRFQTVTPVWIQISWWNDAKGLMLLRRDALLFF